MANLDPTADKAVRDAVDAFLEGRLAPEFSGETVFETKNSRYRLLDGVVFAAPDDSLVGSELVGWLMESRRRSVVESAWQPGSRAVLVDRHRGQNIIVTSTTRLLHLEEHASRESGAPPPDVRPYALPLPAPPPFSPRRAPIVPSTPLPPQFGAAASSINEAAAVQRRAAAIHLPPRPMAPPSRAAAPVMPPIMPPIMKEAPARPLPLPAPPPRRVIPSLPQVNPHAPAPQLPVAAASPRQPPVAGTPWELTSSEFEVEGEATKPDYVVGNSARHDAAQYPSYDSSDPSTDEMVAGADFGTDAPIPLLRPLDVPLPPPSPRTPLGYPVADPRAPRPRR